MLLLNTSLGKKYWMALTGLGLLIFVIVHLAGNLQIFLGPEWLNDYAHHLMEWQLVVWPARVGLLAALLFHVGVGVSLALQNRSARPVRYAANDVVQTSLASRTMVLTGFLIFFFVVYHLCHFTFGVTDPATFDLYDKNGHHDVYSMVVLSFQNPWVAGSYVVAMFVLAMHLSHGSWSFLRTLGLLSESQLPAARRAAMCFSVFIFFAYSSIAVASYFGWLQPLQEISRGA